jgi:Na+/H+-dicarboxylate symporter
MIWLLLNRCRKCWWLATLASIGAAAVPSAGIIVLVIVLAQAGIPEAGLALIFAVDRPLDMCRTVVNITGDATVSMIVDKIVSKKWISN